MGFFIYKLNDDKIASTDQLSELKNKISQLENNKLKTYEESTTSQTTSKESNIQKSLSYSNLQGIYEYSQSTSSGNASYSLTLYENGTFQYLIAFEEPTTLIGNYIIENDEILLNEWFVMGGSTGLSAVSQTLKIKINSDETITDTNHLSEDDKNFGKINLVKSQNKTTSSNGPSVNDLIKSKPLFNDYNS